MPPDAKVIDCIVNVASPGNPMVPWLLSGTIVGVILIVMFGFVVWSWIDKRDHERDLEIIRLRRETKELRAEAKSTGTI